MIEAKTAIRMSRRENRTVTLYPDATEYAAIQQELRCAANGSAEHSGAGYSGPESRGWLNFWGDDWQVALVRPRAG